MAKIRKMGEILLDLEPLLLEMVEIHNMQHGDIIYLIKAYLDIHCPGAIEEYEDGSNPFLKYGPKD